MISPKYAISPQDGQIAKAKKYLTLILMPLENGEHLPDDLSNCIVAEDGCVICDRTGWDYGFMFQIKYEIGAHLYFLEPWTYSNARKKVQSQSFFHEDAHEFVQWLPPAFMPAEAARFWFKVTGIEVKRIKDISLIHFVTAGLCNTEDSEADAIARWNEAYPRYPYSPELWTLILMVEQVDFLDEEEL